jgi:hypothetical protein
LVTQLHELSDDVLQERGLVARKQRGSLCGDEVEYVVQKLVSILGGVVELGELPQSNEFVFLVILLVDHRLILDALLVLKGD